MHDVDPAKLLDRRGVIVDAQIGNRVRRSHVAAVLADDEERGRLLPPAVASRGLRRRECVEEALGERLACRCLERSPEGVTVSSETRMFPCAA